MGWPATLRLTYRSDDHLGVPRTVVHDLHEGPLRILASLYPEAPAVCHNVLVHAPGGIVGGDTLAIDATLAPRTHALITTPGATRFYRSASEPATQTLAAHLADGARLEWLPLETIAHSGCLAENRMRFELAPGAEMIGWDVLALGLPASREAFERGRYTQRIELPGQWLERALIDAADTRLLNSPLGWAEHRVLCTMWFAAGAALDTARRESLLDSAREVCSGPCARRDGRRQRGPCRGRRAARACRSRRAGDEPAGAGVVALARTGLAIAGHSAARLAHLNDAPAPRANQPAL